LRINLSIWFLSTPNTTFWLDFLVPQEIKVADTKLIQQVIHHHAQTLRTPISMSVLKSLTYQLLNGLLYLHEAHIIHRDLKPANILINSSGTVKIGDLGLARITYQPLQPLFAGDKVVVTIWYRAPELLMGARHYHWAVDTWAVGCVIAELASLRPIFKGEEAKMDGKKNVPFQRDQLIKVFEVVGTPDGTFCRGTSRSLTSLIHDRERLAWVCRYA
jgi:cyclin-dependent kinase 8/11